ncbi:AraC family transcriptional regulator [Mycobacterium sp. AT1]|uniref:AraC family transcriptional regulator n=1 Tax=Mycobacterium sp. AT1 TaxID=1961706 RepID=UPI0018E9647E|nr:AraC family transcriptional regulator [Mycobacterium sp. AT1]
MLPRATPCLLGIADAVRPSPVDRLPGCALQSAIAECFTRQQCGKMSQMVDAYGLPSPIGYFRTIQRALGADGDFLEGTGLTQAQVESSTVDIDLGRQLQQIRNVVDRCGRDWVFQQPEIWGAAMHGAVAIAATSAPTIGRALEVMQRFGRSRASWSETRITSTRQHICFDLDLSVPLEVDEWRHLIEVHFVTVRYLVQSALGREPKEMSFFFRCPQPDYDGRIRQVLGHDVQFSASANRVRIPRNWGSMRPVGEDPRLHAQAIDELSGSADIAADTAYFKLRVERTLRGSPQGRLSADDVAKSLAVSRRTMARRLLAEGTTFRVLSDNEAKRRARAMSRAGLTREVMAVRLGYDDPTSLSRAWRRWAAQDSVET